MARPRRLRDLSGLHVLGWLHFAGRLMPGGRLRAELNARTCIEVLLLVGHCQMLAQTLGTLRVQPDRDRR